VRTFRRAARLTTAMLALALAAAACGSGPEDPAAETPEATQTLTVYSGRSQELVGWVFDEFTAETGIEVKVRYGDTAELAATILEEGDRSPADLYFAQDAGALGALQAEGLLAPLPDDLLDVVDPVFRSREGEWTGITGRVRVLAYNTDRLDAAEVPDSVFDLADPSWAGRVGWAPTNGSFQAFVTAMRSEHGDAPTRTWLEGMVANDPAVFETNTAIIEGVARGEVDLALTNHYYLHRFLATNPEFNVANKYLPGDIGGLVNVAGIAMLASSDSQDAAVELIRFLLSDDVQTRFASTVDALEFPLRTGVEAPGLPSTDEIDPPDVDLSDLADLRGTLDLLREVGAIR